MMTCENEIHPFLNSWKKNNNYSQSESWLHKKIYSSNSHSYFGFIPKDSKAIFLGTFPISLNDKSVEERNNANFFYHSYINIFWDILSIIIDKNLCRKQSKLSWLTSGKIGITDILYEIKRSDTKCCSSADRNLEKIVYNNVYDLLKDFDAINDVYLTSGGPATKKLNGKSAGGWLGQHIREESKAMCNKLENDGATQTIKLHGRVINLHYLITPSPNNQKLKEYLNRNIKISQVLNSIKFLEDKADTIIKYKCVQWACYLSKYPDSIVDKILLKEINEKNLHKILMEYR